MEISNTKAIKKTPYPASFLVPTWLKYATPAFLGVLGSLFYFPSLHYDFQFDDIANITRQFSIRHGTFWSLFMNGPRWVSYWLNTIHYSLGKFNPFSYRLGNLCIHTLTAIAIFYLLWVLLKNSKKESFYKSNAYLIAFATAAIFLLHPVQTQTVSYVIQGQLEGMAALFSLWALISLYYAFKASELMHKILGFVGAFSAAFIATGCKEISIVLPALALLMDWFFIAHANSQEFKKRWIAHTIFALFVVSLYVYFLKPTFFIQLLGFSMQARNNIGNILTHSPEDKILPLPFFISQFKVLLHYLQIFIWPFNMSVEYDWKLVQGFFALDCILPLATLVALGYFVWRLIKKNACHPIAFGALWFLIAVLPRSSIIPSSELLSDYKTYLPAVGISVILAIGLVQFLIWVWKKITFLHPYQDSFSKIAALTLLLLPLGFCSYQRNKIWRTAENFWLNIIQNAPKKARAYNNYAVALSERGAYKEALPFFQQAIDMDSSYPDPLNNIAVAYSVLGDLDKGIEALKQSITINPNYPEAYNNIASFLIQQNKLDPAEHMLNVALQLRPYYGKAFFNLGKIYLMRNDLEKSHFFIKKACLEGDFDNEMGYKTYAEMSARLNKAEDTLLGYTKLVELKPEPENIFGLANALFMNNKNTEALIMYEKLVKLSPDPRFFYNLGEAYVKLQHFEKALSAFEKAAPLKSSMPTLCLRQAYCLDQLKRTPEAFKCLEEALSYPNLPLQHRNIAQAMVNGQPKAPAV